MHNKEIYRQAIEFVTKWGAWVAYIAIGLVGKFGWDILQKKKLSFWYIFGTGCVAIFVGFFTSMWCKKYEPDSGAFIVPIATLISRDIMLFITMLDWKRILNLIINKEVTEKEQ